MSSFDHFVTQWMSRVTVSDGSARNSSHVQLRGSSISDYRDERGEPGAFQHAFRVYERAGEPCPRCGGVIRRRVIIGRSSFYCPGCQR